LTTPATNGSRPPAESGASEPAASSGVLIAHEVSKTFGSAAGERTQALTPVDLTVRPGEFVSLVGPSGCGKTTLLKILSGLIAPTSGSISFGGQSGPVAAGSYGIVFQNAALLPWRNVLKNVMLPADLLGLERSAAEERARRLLDLVQLHGQEDKMPTELSGGMQQRTAIARALLHDPEVLFMDEPFGALDAMTREELNQQLQEVHGSQHKTVVFVTHSIPEAVTLSDRVVVMSSRPARIVEEIPIALPRPRTERDTTSEPFRDYESRIRNALHST
jgi:NitT/TauT family transport system ATP-binding protein